MRRLQQETDGQQGEAEQEASIREASWRNVMRRTLGALGILVIWWRRISPEVSENKDNILYGVQSAEQREKVQYCRAPSANEVEEKRPSNTS